MMQELQTLLRAQAGVPREFEPCFNEKPVFFTDAHGRVHRIHLEWCNSWEVRLEALALLQIDLTTATGLRSNSIRSF
jgi:hypothetical protein